MSIIFILLVVQCLILGTFANTLHTQFYAFQSTYNKTYSSSEEEAYRFQIFSENVIRIEDHNTDPGSTYVMDMNKYGDLTAEEFKSFQRGYDTTVLQRSGKELVNTTGLLRGQVPVSVDWAAAGKVSSVKDQLYCGGCWAFSVTDAVESRFAIYHDVPVVELSIQEQLDCNHDGVNEGCVGGNLPEGYDYVIDMKGLCKRKEYEFRGESNSYQCKSRRNKCTERYGAIRDYGIVIPNSEKALQQAVAQGPVAIAIEADAYAMQFYSKGILTSKKCGVNVDHAVVMVGYGEYKGTKYWKIKNSWSKDWGEKGYMRLCRECGRNGKTGECGITVESVYPIV